MPCPAVTKNRSALEKKYCPKKALFLTSLLIVIELGKTQMAFSTGISVEFWEFAHLKKSLPEMSIKSDQSTRVRCRRPNDEIDLPDDMNLLKSL